jgi:hypothetical protein
MFLRLTIFAAAVISLCSADTLTLRSGRTVHGQYLGGDTRHIRLAVGDRVDTFDVDDVSDLQFGPASRDSDARPSDSARYQDRDRDHGRDQGFAQQPPPPAAAADVQIPVGTPITVRMIDSVDSNEARLGQTFRASIDEPVAGPNGQVVIPRGSDALVKLVEDQQSGKFQGRAVLTLVLMQITVAGATLDTTTSDVSQASGSRGARTAKVVGGTTALGAIIGALAGGGRGAAIGAASGAAVGGGVQLATKGQQVRVPSETRLTFTLQQPIQL